MTLLAELSHILPRIELLTSPHDCAYASLDQSTNVAPCMPALVARVRSCEELVAVARVCFKHKNAVVIRAAGTGKSGGAVPKGRAVVIDITRLNKIIAIDKKNLLAEVEPGVVLAHLQCEVLKQNLFYPPDPASRESCTLGGNVAENASGPSTIKYGSTRDYLLGGQALLATGELIDFGKRTVKGVTGYDIAALLCGSEGTLAIFTRLILRLLPAPKSMVLTLYHFADEDEALHSVNEILLAGHRPAALEYIDEKCWLALSRYLSLQPVAGHKASLMIECDSIHEEGALREIEAIDETLSIHAMVAKVLAREVSHVAALRHQRNQLSEACSAYLGHKISEDIAVPLGMIAKFGAELKEKARAFAVLECGIFGHAGDGNLHVQIMFAKGEDRAKAEQLRHEVLLLVLSLGGTLSAEHGIGLQKKSYLSLEQSPELISLQRRLKKAFDPENLLNPGAIFDA